MKFNLLVLLLIMVSNVQAATEDLVADNSSYSSAQNIGTLNADDGFLNVFGFRGVVSLAGGAFTLIDNDNADFFSFEISELTTLSMNVFTPEGSLENDDPVLGLFNQAGALLEYNDDGGAGYDSYLSYYISTPGIYIAAVSGFNDFDFLGGGDTDFQYNLQLTTDTSVAPNPVPVPAAVWFFASALFTLIGYGRKRHKNI